MIISVLFVSKQVDAKALQAQLSFNGDTVHFEMSGATNWDYDLNKKNINGTYQIEMLIPAIDDQSIKKISGFSSELVKKVVVNKAGQDGKYILKFELAGNEVETFDYLTDQPSKLIVDFFVTEGNKAKLLNRRPEKKETIVEKIEFDKPTDVKETKKVSVKEADAEKLIIVEDNKSSRKPATSDFLKISTEGSQLELNGTKKFRAGIFDGGDPNYDRFSIKDFEIKQEAILKSRENYYIPFPLLEVDSRYWLKMQETPTIYQIYPKTSVENKQARLLLKLFEQKKWATYLKTLEYFKDKYPETEYNEILSFMTGDVYYNMWKEQKHIKYFDQAMNEYVKSIEKYPNSLVSEKMSLSLGYATYDRGDYLRAIQLFNDHIQNKKYNSEKILSRDLAKIGSGLAYYKLNKFSEAFDVFNEVEKSSIFPEIKSEAAFRKGDVYLRGRKFQESVDEYQKALKNYPNFQSDYPSAYYNQAESLFGLQKYKQCLDIYSEFIRRFPNHDQLPYALTRVGEVLEILGADKDKVQGAYLETFFRYGENPKAIIARLHLLSSKMKTMRGKELVKTIAEIQDLAKKIDLPKIEQFSNLMISDGYTQRGEFSKSYDLLIKYYQQNPQAEDLQFVKNRITSNIVSKMKNEVTNNDFMSTFKTFSEFKDSWLKSTKRLDVEYFLGRSYEQGGSQKEASKKYLDVLNQMYSVRGTEAEKENTVLQYLPTIDQLNLRLAKVHTEMNDFNKSYDFLKNIKQPDRLLDSEQIERVNLAVNLLEQKGDIESAIRYLTELLKTWRGEPSMVSGPYLKLADLEFKTGKKDDAIQSLKKIDQIFEDTQNVTEDIHAKALEKLGKIYQTENNIGKASEAFSKLLKLYEDKRPLASIRYKLGEMYFKKGDLQKASDAWSTFKGEKNEFWKKLAQEQLQNNNWGDDYKKYMKRIPAMAKPEKSNQ